MRLGVDLDGTSLDFIGHFMARYEQWYGRAPDPAHLDEWDNICTATHFAGHAEALKWADRAHLWSDMPWVPGAQGFVERALTEGHQVEFLTARSGVDAVLQTTRWFHSLPFSSRDHFRFPAVLKTACTRKSSVACSWYIDDAPHVLEELIAEGKRVVIFDRPWNRPIAFTDPKATLTGAIPTRLTNWVDIATLILDGGEK